MFWGFDPYVSSQTPKASPCAELRHMTYWSSKTAGIGARAKEESKKKKKVGLYKETETCDKSRVRSDHPRRRSTT